MVLRDIESADGFPSNVDPDSSTSSSDDDSGTLEIDLSTLPQPLPILGPLCGWTANRNAIMMTNSIAALAKIVERPPRQEEAEAMAYQIAACNRIMSTCEPAGLLAGAWRWRASDATRRLPIFRPPADLNPDTGLTGQLKSVPRRLLWQGLRLSWYLAMGYVVGNLAGHALTLALVSPKFTNDPRLKEFHNALAKMRFSDLASQLEQQRSRRTAEPQPSSTYDDRDDDNNSSNNNEMSPQDGNISFSLHIFSDEQARRQEAARQLEARWPPTQNTDSAVRTDKAWSQPRDLGGGGGDDFGDDSSPTARPAPQDSAWERLRRRAASGQPDSSAPSGSTASSYGTRWSPRDRQPQPQQQQGGASAGDSFSFSASDEGRQLARAEAQRDFDARVERERRGQDFDETPGRRRW